MKALVTDWDGTVSQDTMHLLGQAVTHELPWSHFLDLYLAEYSRFTQSTPPPSTLDDELHFQHGLRCAELSSLNEAVKVRLFKDLHIDSVQEQAADVDVFSGSMDFIKQATQLDIPVYILSVNWTSLIMQRVLQIHGIDITKVRFITNELECIDSLLTGDVLNDIHTGSDKLLEFTLIKEELQSQGITDDIYYIGDSSTDFLTLLEANYGVIFGDGSALTKFQQYSIAYDEGINGPHRYKHIHSWCELAPLLE